MTTEIWAPIPKYEGKYEISNFGNIRSYLGKDKTKPRLKKNCIVSGMYTCVLNNNGISTTYYVAELVLLTFHGTPPEFGRVHFLDGNKLNINLYNLIYKLQVDVTENWKEIPGFNGLYKISSLGSVCSFASGRPKELSGYVNKDGYITLKLIKNEVQDDFFVHRLVLETFVGPCPEGMQTRHLNGIRDDNRLENLAWGTPQENSDDKVLHGTIPSGETHPLYGKEVPWCAGDNHWSKKRPEDTLKGANNAAAKLDEAKVYNILDMLTKKLASRSELARYYQIDQTIPGRIFDRKKWQHVIYPVVEPLHSEYTKEQEDVLRFVEEDRIRVKNNKVPPPRGPKKIVPRKSAISETKALEILLLKRNTNMSDQEISEKVGLKRKHVNDIINGKLKCFEHLSGLC